MDHGMDESTANRWCDAWEIEAAGRAMARDATYWQAGADWIAAERAARRPGEPVVRVKLGPDNSKGQDARRVGGLRPRIWPSGTSGRHTMSRSFAS